MTMIRTRHASSFALAVVVVIALLVLNRRTEVSVHGFVVVVYPCKSARPIHWSLQDDATVGIRIRRSLLPPDSTASSRIRAFRWLGLSSSASVTEASDVVGDNENDKDDFISVSSFAMRETNWNDGEDALLKQALRQDLMDSVTDAQLDQLLQLRDLVVDWNQRINLVSRKDCTPQTVWERHILPCVAMASSRNGGGSDSDGGLLLQHQQLLFQQANTSVVDVGTGGGFPGLPLAILFPTVQFTLLDSVGKKLAAVQDMADTLQLTNVQTHHGRAEDWRVVKKFTIATGRSVASFDSFCAWMHHLLLPITGTLLYWIGGDIDPDTLQHATADVSIASELLPSNHLSPLAQDKRILVFPQAAVTKVARESGIVVKPTLVGGGSARREPQKKQRSSSNNNNRNGSSSKDKTAKGAWAKKRNDPDHPNKERGYEGFKRYSSSSGSQS